MRRKDREITDISEILRIIEACDVCRLGLARDNIPYIVPMNFGYKFTDGTLVLYFHAAKEGKKLDIISHNPVACFEMDCSHRLIEGSNACDFTMEYESVIGNGRISMCTEKEEKREVFRYLMKQYAKDKTFSFPDAMLDAVTTFKMVVTDFTGKRLMKK